MTVGEGSATRAAVVIACALRNSSLAGFDNSALEVARMSIRRLLAFSSVLFVASCAPAWDPSMAEGKTCVIISDVEDRISTNQAGVIMASFRADDGHAPGLRRRTSATLERQFSRLYRVKGIVRPADAGFEDVPPRRKVEDGAGRYVDLARREGVDHVIHVRTSSKAPEGYGRAYAGEHMGLYYNGGREGHAATLDLAVSIRDGMTGNRLVGTRNYKNRYGVAERMPFANTPVMQEYNEEGSLILRFDEDWGAETYDKMTRKQQQLTFAALIRLFDEDVKDSVDRLSP